MATDQDVAEVGRVALELAKPHGFVVRTYSTPTHIVLAAYWADTERLIDQNAYQLEELESDGAQALAKDFVNLICHLKPSAPPHLL